MQTHTFDPMSFFFGLVFVAAAAWGLLIDAGLDLDGRWVWPIVLVAGGLALLVSSFSGRLSRPADDVVDADAEDEL